MSSGTKEYIYLRMPLIRLKPRLLARTYQGQLGGTGPGQFSLGRLGMACRAGKSWPGWQNTSNVHHVDIHSLLFTFIREQCHNISVLYVMYILSLPPPHTHPFLLDFPSLKDWYYVSSLSIIIFLYYAFFICRHSLDSPLKTKFMYVHILMSYQDIYVYWHNTRI